MRLILRSRLKDQKTNMPRSSRRHLFIFILLLLFTLVFAGFLAVATYYYLSGAENVTIKSFAPGLPAIYLGFMARKEWRAMKAMRKMEARKRRLEGAE